MDHSHNRITDYNENTVYLVGNPNVGKSAIFTAITNKYATISNYPGTTVEITTGYIQSKLNIKGKAIKIVDTPGINSIVPLSEDEKITRDILYNHELQTGKKPDVILVIDAKNIKRGLMLAVQLTFVGIPFFIVLNMMDEARSLGIEIDKNKLSDLLKVPVVNAIAIQKEGISEIVQIIRSPIKSSDFNVKISTEFQPTIEEMLKLTNPLLALSVFYSDTSIKKFLTDKLIFMAEKLLAKTNLNMAKFQQIWNSNANDLYAQVYSRDIQSSSTILNMIGKWTINPYTGFFLMTGIIYTVYKFVGILGAGILVDLLSVQVFDQYVVPTLIKLIESISLPLFITDMLVGQYGLLSMGLTYSIAIIFPIVITFFISFSFLEDSGYLPRMGALLNGMFKIMGLNGKAILPIIMGLGCDTMATMTARVMDSKKERILVTLLLALGVPCSAQLGVIFALAVYLPFSYLLAWVAIIVLVMIIVGYIGSKIIPGKNSMFLLELPPLRIPHFKNLLSKTYMRSKWYIKEAIPIFLAGTFILFLLDKSGAIQTLNDLLKPFTVNALGLPAESASSFVMGFLRRDFGAAGFYQMYSQGLLDERQVLTSLVVITLFVPCIANLLMIIKERGLIIGMSIFLFIIPFAFFTGFIMKNVMDFIPQ